MKIIYILKSFAQLAGTERVMADKINYLAQKGYSITLITYEQGVHPLAYKLHPTVKHIDLETRFFTLQKHSLLTRSFYYIKLKRLFRKKLQGIVNEQKPDYIVTTTYSLKVAKDILRAKYNAKTIMESHINHDSLIKHYEFKKNDISRYIFKVYDKINKNTLEKYDLFVSLTEKDATQWRMSGIKTKVIPNPITNYPKEINTNKNHNNRIIAVGRLNHQKGFDQLIEAFSLISSKYPEWRIDIFGKGELERELNSQIIQKRQEGRVIINQPTKDIYREYLNSDFLVLSSKFEGFGLVLIEAMACGIPVVSFDCPYGPNEIITDMKDGILVKNGNVDQLSEKMEWMITHKVERTEMGIQARVSAKKYEIKHIMSIWEELFKNKLK